VAISEAARSDLYNGLIQVLGPERAETLMSAIPLHDLDQVATKGDLAVLAADVRSEMAGLRTELKTDIAALRAEMHTELGSLRRSMTGWMLTLLVAIIAALTSINFLS
jgi:hypothetical protein